MWRTEAFYTGILLHLNTVQAVDEIKIKEQHLLFTGQQFSSFRRYSKEATGLGGHMTIWEENKSKWKRSKILMRVKHIANNKVF